MDTPDDKRQFIALRVAQSAANFARVYDREPDDGELAHLVPIWQDAAEATWGRNMRREAKRQRVTIPIEDLNNEPHHEDEGLKKVEARDELHNVLNQIAEHSDLAFSNRTILDMLIKGVPQTEIARRMELSEDIINRRVSIIRQKLVEKNLLR